MIPLGPVVQIAYFVPDARAAAERMAAIHGAGPFHVLDRIELAWDELRGEPCSTSAEEDLRDLPAVRALEAAHVLDDTEDGDVHSLEHLGASKRVAALARWTISPS